MKTAISLPDPLFREADEVARRLGISRSQLYARALEAHLRQLRDDEITASWNRLAADIDSALPPEIAAAAVEVLRREPW